MGSRRDLTPRYFAPRYLVWDRETDRAAVSSARWPRERSWPRMPGGRLSQVRPGFGDDHVRNAVTDARDAHQQLPGLAERDISSASLASTR